MNKLYIKKKNLLVFCFFLFSLSVFGGCLLDPIESYYTIKDYDSPHFHLESLSLDQETFIELMDRVNQKTRDRAFIIEVPNELYSENVAKLRAARFFHYYDFPEKSASVWCRTNGSGVPLAASHTFGARGLVYYKNDSDYFFLLVKDKYGNNGYEAPGGYVQPKDDDIIEYFEKGYIKTTNIDYRSPKEAVIDEIFEETGFDVTKYGYDPEGRKEPFLLAQVYTKNTRPGYGIHSVNNCCQYFLFKVTPNEDNLKKQEHEILDVRWVSYNDIIKDKIDSPINIESSTSNVKKLVQRIVSAEMYADIKTQLDNINKEIWENTNDVSIEKIKTLIKQQQDLETIKKDLEFSLHQEHTESSKKRTIYFALF